jgi:cobalt-zinc-cadmium efflux system outer membrane protein
VRRPSLVRGFLIAVLAALACPAALMSAQGQTAQAAVPLAPLTYDAALDLATSRNLGLEAARRQRAIREAAIRIAGQRPNPDVSFDVTRDTPHYAAGVGLPVEIGGRRSRRLDLAKEELTLADVDLRVELRLVRKELRQAFYSLVAADERVRLDESVLEISRRVRDAAQARFETGAAPRLEVLQADLGVTRAEVDLDVARSTRAASQASLNAVLNLPPQQAVAVSGTLVDRIAAPSYESALALAIASNVELIRLDREIAVEQRRGDLLRAERVPTPVVSVGGVFNNPGEFNAGLSAGVSVGLPIFSRNQGEIAQSIATTSQLRAVRDETRRDVENNVFGTVAKIDAQRRQVEAFQQRLVPTATDLESLAEESYRAGRTSILAVFDAQRSLRDLRREALQVMLDLQFSLADLEEILGTGLP